MSEYSAEDRAGIEKLSPEYKKYVEDLQRRWVAANRSQSQNCLEVMNKEERQEVQNIINRWNTYIKPLVEEWWKLRGWKINFTETPNTIDTLTKILPLSQIESPAQR